MQKVKISALVAVIFVIFFAMVSFAEEGILTISSTTGKVLVKISPSNEWTEAKVGQALNPKDAIKTDKDSKATLEFPEKSSFSLKGDTEIIIEELIWDSKAKKVGVNMTSGELRTIIKKLDTPSEFKIKTPTAICGAKGTIFYVVVFPNGTGVYVTEGLVDFLNTVSGESYTVYQGNTSNANSDGTSTTPQELTKEEVDQIMAGYDMQVVAEPYTEPGGADTPPSDFTADTPQENAASGR